MDEDTQAALADLKQGIANLAAGIALVARHQTVQGEKIDRILALLTPEEEERQGPTTQELIEQMMAENAGAVQDLKQRLWNIGQAVDGVPGRTVQAMDQAYSLPPKQQP